MLGRRPPGVPLTPSRPRTPDGRRGRRPPGDARRTSPARTPTRSAGLGGEQVEGRRAVRELLLADRRPVRQVWLSEAVEEDGLVAEIIELAGRQGVPLRRVSRGRLDGAARTEAPQGVLALAAPLPEVPLEELAAPGPRAARAPFLLVLDGVTDPHNLGALLRTAECAGSTGVVLGRHRAVHVTPTVTKAAAGAIEHLPLAIAPGTPAALTVLARAGVWTVGLDRAAPLRLWDLELATEPVALVLGAEGRGLSRLASARCDVLVAIPEWGAIESLNVAAAGAVACFEVARRRA